MIQTVVIAFVVFLLVVVGMAVGVIVSNRRIAGSCGGLGAIEGLDSCGVCGKDFTEAKRSGELLDCDRV